MFGLFSRADPQKEAARSLFRALAEQARRADFYTRFKVPDTIDGRFDLLALHGYIVMEGLRGEGPRGERIGTHLATAIFESLEEALRELGVGDTGIARRIKAMADAFYGRLAAYSSAKDPAAMADALLRNLYRGENGRRAEAELLTDYVFASRESAQRADGSLVAGAISFAPLSAQPSEK